MEPDEDYTGIFILMAIAAMALMPALEKMIWT